MAACFAVVIVQAMRLAVQPGMQGLLHIGAVTWNYARPHLMCDFDVFKPLKERVAELSTELEIGRGKDAFGAGLFLVEDDAQPGMWNVEEFAALVTVG